MSAAATSSIEPSLRVSGLTAKVLYGIGEMPVTISMVLFGLFTLFFYNTVMGLPASLVGFAIAGGLVLDAFLDLQRLVEIAPRLHEAAGREHLLDERLGVRFLQAEKIRPERRLIGRDRLLRVRDLPAQLLDLDLGILDLCLGQRDLCLYFIFLEIERVDGRLERLLVRAHLLELALILRYLLIEGGHRRVIGIELGLEGAAAYTDVRGARGCAGNLRVCDKKCASGDGAKECGDEKRQRERQKDLFHSYSPSALLYTPVTLILFHYNTGIMGRTIALAS